MLDRFGVDRDGLLVWGRVQESKSAAAQYQANVYQGSEEDPALLQWAGSGVYETRLYLIASGASRRVVTRYSEWLSRQGSRGERRLYVYPMAAEGAKGSLPRIEELRISVDLSRSGAKSLRSGMGGQRDGQLMVVKAFDVVPRADFALELLDDGQPALTAYRTRHVLGERDAENDDALELARETSRPSPTIWRSRCVRQRASSRRRRESISRSSSTRVRGHRGLGVVVVARDRGGVARAPRAGRSRRALDGGRLAPARDGRQRGSSRGSIANSASAGSRGSPRWSAVAPRISARCSPRQRAGSIRLVAGPSCTSATARPRSASSRPSAARPFGAIVAEYALAGGRGRQSAEHRAARDAGARRAGRASG